MLRIVQYFIDLNISMAKIAPIEIENCNERRPSLTDGVKEVDQTERRKYNLTAVDGNYNNPCVMFLW